MRVSGPCLGRPAAAAVSGRVETWASEDVMELLTPCSPGRGGSACRAWVGPVAPILSPGDQEAFIKGKGIHLLISARISGEK